MPVNQVFNPSPVELSAVNLFSASEAEDEKPSGEGDGANDTLEDAARRERDYVRERLEGELGREPTEEEVNEWLRRHTEGY